MADLNDRQLHILKAVIDEYIQTAEPVGSETLDKKYNLGVSPATIRNEMVRLTQAGYLMQPHTSAGRTPTPVALKLYVDKLMQPDELSVADEVTVKQKVWDHRSEMDKTLREATRALAQQSKAMSLSFTDEGSMYVSGLGNILEMPEFFDIDVTRHLLDTLDEYDFWWKMFSSMARAEDPITVILGEDLGSSILNQCGGIFIRFQSPTHQGAIGVVGPSRLNYPRIVPLVRYMGHLMDDIARHW